MAGEAIGANGGKMKSFAMGAGLGLATALIVTPFGQTASAAGSSITIADPGKLSAGQVTLRGTVTPGSPSDTPTVLYILDASGSTSNPGGSCGGDLNGDGDADTILDCEIAGVTTLDGSLASQPGVVLTGLAAFAGGTNPAVADAATASLQTTAEGERTFAPAGYTGGSSTSRLDIAARGVIRSHITQLIDKDLDGRGTNYDEAVSVALSALSAAPAGPKYIMFLSDGQGSASDATVNALTASGVHLRAFDISGSGACSTGGSLLRLAAATNEQCVNVHDPSTLSAQLAGSQPEGVNGVTVTINGVSVAADLDAIGGWAASFQIGQGTYTVTARASLLSGATVSATRTITVADAPGGPPPGGVTPVSLKASKVHALRSAPTFGVLPAKVTGKANPYAKSTSAKVLNGATVKLEARTRVGATWVKVGSATVHKGAFALSWKPNNKMRFLRVELKEYHGYASSVAAVPKAPINACHTHRSGGARVLTCHTVAKHGSQARLLRGSKVLDTAKVKHGKVTVKSRTALSGDVLSVDVSKRKHYRLHL
jgi:hypothetical protein